jgi:NADH dehydrogenase
VIVVAGGTGVLGREVVARLVAAGQAVRVLTRDATRARQVLGDGVKLAVGDVRDRGSVTAAVDGASVVVSAVHGFLGGRGAGPAEIDVRGNATIATAAATAGADVVLLSVLGASASSPMELFRAKYAAEQQLRSAGAGWTIVRPAAYLETWIAIMRDTARKSGRPLVFGKGEQPMAFVSALDVAAVVANAATDPTMRGQVIEVAGARLTMCELAAAVQRADGRTTAPRHIPRGMLQLTGLLAGPISPSFARQNRAALVMDTTDLATHAESGQLSVPASRTLSAVLAGTS